MRASIVLGMGFGDEGKGLITSYLCHKKPEKTLVVRFCGGHQAGHHVMFDGMDHIFSSFGSGTLMGCPTYWSQYCPFEPMAMMNERRALMDMGLAPRLFVHPLAPVTLPWDRALNQKQESVNKHGSCGVGIGATWQRHDSHHRIHVQDLFYPSVLKLKLTNLANYYYPPGTVYVDDLKDYLERVQDCWSAFGLTTACNLYDYSHFVFEGAQGIMLDQQFGFFPNVTRSHTTSRNAIKLWNEFAVSSMEPEIYYVTRSYQTRHGHGPMTNEGKFDLPLVNTERETNVTDPWQGEFRTGMLDGDLLRYALECDSNYAPNKHHHKHLCVTCVDQTGEKFPFTKNIRQSLISGVLGLRNYLSMFGGVDFKSVMQSTGPITNEEKCVLYGAASL